MNASELRQAAVKLSGCTIRSPMYYQVGQQDKIANYMLMNGCHAEYRDISRGFTSSLMRWGWKAPDGSWVACDIAELYK